MRFRSETKDPRAILNLARHGHTTQALAAALPRRHTTHPVLAASDPYPFVVTGHKLIRRIRGAQRPVPSVRPDAGIMHVDLG